MTTAALGYQVLAVTDLHESKKNPRRHFDAAALADLTSSVAWKGVLTPLLVRPNAAGYQIAAGHRRFRAARAAGLTEVPVIVREMSDTEFLEVLTVENLQREDVHPLEADGYRALMKQAGYDVAAIAAKVGKSTSYVYQRLKLAELVEPARKAFLSDELTAGHAILLARLQPKDQAAALKAAIQTRWIGGRDDLHDREVKAAVSVRELNAWIERNVHLDLLAAAFPKDDATLVPKAGPCGACPKRTGNNPDLFGEVKKGDTCTDPACFKSKAAAHIDRQVAALKLPGKAVRVSEQWYVHGEEKALKSRQWALAGATTCGSIRAGIFVDGNNEGQVGKVCIDPKCKVHRPKESRSSVSGGGGAEYAERERARAQKAQAKGEHRRAIAEAILAKVAEGALARPILQLVVKGFWSDVWYEARRVLTRLHGWAGDEDKAKDPDRYRSSKLAGLSGQQVNALLVSLAVAKDLLVGAYDESEPRVLLEMARAYKVDVAKLDRERKAAAATKSARKRVQTSAKSKRAKKKRK